MLNKEELLKYISDYVANNIMSEFHNKKIAKIADITLKEILRRKNPYLFKAKNATNVTDFIKPVLEASLSSSEETIFGNFLEQIAIEICKLCRNGRKSGIVGIDLEFDEAPNVRYFISIKSGPNWGNSGQITKMIDNFKKAEKVIRTSNNSQDDVIIKFVEGCCYGTDNKPYKTDRQKLCGERFWSFLSNGGETLYKDIIEPMGVKAKEHNERFIAQYNAKLNQLTREFLENFCTQEGFIDWIKLVTFNSGKDNKKIL